MPTESWSGSDGTNISRDLTWVETIGDWEVVGNKVRGPVTERSTARLDVDLTDTHYAEVDVEIEVGDETSGKAGPAVRMSSDGNTYYAWTGHNTDTATFGRSLYRYVNGTGGRIETRLDGFVQSGRLRLEVADDADGNVVLTCFIDGVEIYTHVDSSSSKITGNVYAGIAKGAGAEGAAVVEFSNFEADALTQRTPIGTYYQGAATHESIQIAVEVRDTHDIRIAYAADEEMTSPSYTSVFADQTGFVKLDVTGLAPYTKYWWCFEVDSVLETEPRGSFRTAPSPGRGSFTFGAASCGGVGTGGPAKKEFRSMSNAVVFDKIREKDPDLFVHMGDFHYRDISGNDEYLHTAALREVLANPRQAALWHSTNLAYVWDDHDYSGTNDGNKTATSRPAVLTAYKTVMPHYPLGVSGDIDEAPIGQTFVYGPARFILLDDRSQRDPAADPPTMIGADQLEWLDSVLASATERVIFLVAVVPWISGSGGDTWAGYTAERTVISDMLWSYGLMDKTIILAGDAHMLAWDDGRNNKYATSGAEGCPVFQLAALGSGSSTKGGPYSGGSYRPANGVTCTQYGLIEVDDSTEKLTVTVTGYQVVDGSESTAFTTSFDFEGAPPEPEPERRVFLARPATSHPTAAVVLTATKGLASDQTEAIQTQLTALSSGSTGVPVTVTMAPGVYRVDGELSITGKSWLDLWMHGVEFRATIDGSPYNERRHFTLNGCSNVTVRGLTIRGTNPYGGTQDAAYVVSKEFQHAFRIYNHCSNILLTHCKGFDLWGDCVYVGAGSGNSNITIRKGEWRRNGRQCFAVVQGSDVFIEENVCSDIRRSWVDVEPNTAAQSVNGVYVRRNYLATSTAEGPGWRPHPHRLSFFANVGPASDIQNIVFEDNYSTGNFNGQSGNANKRRYNLTIQRNIFERTHGTPSGASLPLTNWGNIHIGDNIIPLQVRSPLMHVARVTNCENWTGEGTNLTDPGGGPTYQVWPPEE